MALCTRHSRVTRHFVATTRGRGIGAKGSARSFVFRHTYPWAMPSWIPRFPLNSPEPCLFCSSLKSSAWIASRAAHSTCYVAIAATYDSVCMVKSTKACTNTYRHRSWYEQTTPPKVQAVRGYRGLTQTDGTTIPDT